MEEISYRQWLFSEKPRPRSRLAIRGAEGSLGSQSVVGRAIPPIGLPAKLTKSLSEKGTARPLPLERLKDKRDAFAFRPLFLDFQRVTGGLVGVSPRLGR